MPAALTPRGWLLVAGLSAPACLVAAAPAAAIQEAPRPWEAGIRIGDLPPGPGDAITDVPGVLVGHATLAVEDSLNTGVTAVLPHGGDLFRDRVRAAIVVGNGYGKLVGLSQVQELGELETPILLTGTLRDATEEAIVASLFAAETTSGHLGTAEALPVDRVLELLGAAGVLAGE